MIELTEDEYNGENPQIHAGAVTWQGRAPYESDSEIFLYDGSSVITLTDNNYDDLEPQIHGGQVTWRGYDGNDYEIFLYDGSSVVQLTDNIYGDSYPQIDGGQVTWYGSDGVDYEVYLYNGSSVVQLTDNGYNDHSPQIHNGQVTWQQNLDVYEFRIFVYNGSSVRQLPGGAGLNKDPQIHNGKVAWNHRGAFTIPTRIYVYDGSSSLKIKDNDLGGVGLQFHDGMVTWCSYDGNDYEIYLAKPSSNTIHYDDDTRQFTASPGNRFSIELDTDGWPRTLDPGESYEIHETFTLKLNTGWNMVSLPFLPSDPTASSVLSEAGFYQLVTWDGSGYVEATEFELGKGYWLLVLDGMNVTIWR